MYIIGQLFNHLFTAIYFFFRKLLKGFLRKTTGLCELQRICYADYSNAYRSKAVENSLRLSKSPVLQKIDSELTSIALADQLAHRWEIVEKAVEATLVTKCINTNIHTDFILPYRICLVQIYGYRQLIARLDKLRAITFDPNNESHQKLLKTLWEKLCPDRKLDGLISKQWTEIGFQGSDPSTDFRGMGLLSLENLVFFVTVFGEYARNILSHSLHPTYGYPFAAVGINITHLALNLLRMNHLQTHLFNSETRLYVIEDFHKIYAYLFVSFDKLWIRSKPTSVMEFSHIRDKFEAAVIEKLNDDRAIFRWDPYLETI
ncbi:ELMO domain-containing protein 1 [Dermatophagoides pteronyssinus]|uniref:ELMO domain-containing protein 1 n=1 Tax=Dermatophagoides pteronyssinus TaxID=6956 RepID=A0ABQ8IWU4_DERPT|nr:ELMO domain-containing protein 1 [Dermatophagoides pteronyssinus]